MSLWTWFGLTNGNVSTEWPLKGDAHGQQGVLGMPRYDPAKCQDACDACAQACVTHAITFAPGSGAQVRAEVDWGRCIVCQRCTEVCPTGAFSPSAEWAIGVTGRDDLVWAEAPASGAASVAAGGTGRAPRPFRSIAVLIPLVRRGYNPPENSRGGF